MAGELTMTTVEVLTWVSATFVTVAVFIAVVYYAAARHSGCEPPDSDDGGGE